jgi:4-diphosphocytidyl-2-C-methyl-D-erythritol kinase
MNTFEFRSFAKLNLGLEVLGRRPDGYHDVASVLHEIELHDTFVWSATGDSFEYVSPSSIDPATDLVRRALDLAPDRERWMGRLTLTKNIPLAAGLGGGSSNAALALRLAYPGAIDDAMRARAAQIGSDVPFFLEGGTALATGTGTRLERLPSPRWWFVVVVPPVSLASKTTNMYSRLTANDFSSGEQVQETARTIGRGEFRNLALPSAFLRPALEYRSIRSAWETMQRLLGQAALSGTGPTLYAVFQSERDARDAARELPNTLGRIEVTRSAPARTVSSITEPATALRGTIHW